MSERILSRNRATMIIGQLESRDDIFVTNSGRIVSLRIRTPLHDDPEMALVMYEVFDREYDLDLFNIMVVPDFNMSAKENKSLHILASPETIFDGDYAKNLDVIDLKYFHNWTDKKVTS